MDEQPSTPPPAPSGSQPAAKQNNEMLMGILSYLGILVVVPFLMSKDDPFVRFHIKQGLVLVVIEIVAWLLASILWQFWAIFQLINLGTLILSIIGIVNVVNKKQAELPLVGNLAKNFHF